VIQTRRRIADRVRLIGGGGVGLALALLLAAAGPTRGADRPLRLDEALALAEAANPELQASVERAQSQADRAEGVRKTSWPRLTLTSGWTRTDNPSFVFAQKLNAGEFTQDDFEITSLNAPASLNHLQTALSLEAPIDVFGKVGAQASGQGALSRGAKAAAREALQQLRLEVTEAYRRAELAGRAVQVTEHALAGARAREADVEARVQEGAALEADRLRVRARRRQREADLAERRGDVAVAAARLSRLLALPAEETPIAVEAPPNPSPLVDDEARWTERALAARPLLEVARGREEAAAAFQRGEGKSLLPDLSVLASLQDDRNRFDSGGQSYLVGAFLRMGAFDPSRGKRKAAAEADSRAAAHEVRAAALQVRLDVATAYRRAQAARERLAAAAGGAEEGREALRVVKERREAGLATLTDELETEAQSTAAELDEIRAAAETALADAALRRAAGEI
jgi:outer membrane protein TolC